MFAEALGLTSPDYYYYLNQSATYTVDGINDKKEFEDTMVGIKQSNVTIIKLIYSKSGQQTFPG